MGTIKEVVVAEMYIPHEGCELIALKEDCGDGLLGTARPPLAMFGKNITRAGLEFAVKPESFIRVRERMERIKGLTIFDAGYELEDTRYGRNNTLSILVPDDVLIMPLSLPDKAKVGVMMCDYNVEKSPTNGVCEYLKLAIYDTKNLVSCRDVFMEHMLPQFQAISNGQGVKYSLEKKLERGKAARDL